MKRSTHEFLRAGETPTPARALWLDHWYGRVAMLLTSIILLTLAFAPINQFYLAWIGLVPWILMVRRTRSAWTAFWWSWLGGTAFYIANMWWLAYVTLPGMFALLIYLGLSWGVSAAIIKWMENGKWQMENGNARSGTFSIFHFPFSIVAVATIWSGCEWLRGNFPFDGLPWLYIGHSQTPVLPMCQIADVLGATGVTFWVVLVNAMVARLWLSRGRGGGAAVVIVGLVVVIIGTYGVFRMTQKTSVPGPMVLLIQANFPQSNETGKKGASIDEIVRFHVETTRKALSDKEESDGGERQPATRNSQLATADLVVWSETMMPDINQRARQILRGEKTPSHEDYGAFLQQTFDQIQTLAMENSVAILAGGSYFDARKVPQTGKIVYDNRNSAYYFDRMGLPAGRYDKIHLVPWGEFIPFKHSIPWLHNIFLKLSPYDYDYTLTPGTLDAMPVFDLSDARGAAGAQYRFVVPICFEDIDAGLVAKMLRPRGADEGKRADFLVNITNDGWFKANQQPQHLQVAVFRSIENRVPTARSVNTGISAVIDPLGRVSHTIRQGVSGYLTAPLMLDSRTTWFTRYGDWLGKLCAVATGLIAIVAGARKFFQRKAAKCH